MELSKKSIKEGATNKFDIKLKTKPKDGISLQLHHTVKGSNGERHRIRFSVGTFDDNQEKLACADNAGNIFVLDFADLKFWKIAGVGSCSALFFVPNKIDILAVAVSGKNEINFLDIESGKSSLTLTGHTNPIKHISYSNHKTKNLLTASASEAILWELINYTKYFTLNTYTGAQIQQIMFSPAGEYLVACFQNDTIQIWKHESMKSVKQIIPSEMKRLKNIAFTMNGRAMAIAGLTPTLILFSMDTWKSLKSIDLSKYSLSGVQQVAFIPQQFDGGANKILAILGSDCALYIFDVEALNIIYTIKPESSGIRKFAVSPTGKYFICILQQGEVNIYNSSYVLDLAQSDAENVSKDIPSSSSHRFIPPEQTLKDLSSKVEVEQKMRICMDSARLRRILMQYGEYPDKFRSIIWRSLLNTPRNKIAYAALIDKGIHPAYKDIEKQFSIHSSITLKNLKRLLSCLAHWCPLFGVMKFLPGFVFPFVKVLQKDPLLLFECVATVLINICQLWFEYAPFPPISVLAMVENVLAEHDQHLLRHYCDLGVTSQVYALKILETAFSEVLTCSEWLILWDHILSNEPSFILMAVVSYNIVQRNALKKLNTLEEIQSFFHMQNPIDKKNFLKKTYSLVNETSEDIQPRRFFSSFMSLEKGACYQQFTGYPKATICLKLAKKEKKKILKGNKQTLRDLTTRSQEKEINERAKLDESADIKSTGSDDNSLQDFIVTKKKHKDRLDNAFDKGDWNVNMKESQDQSVRPSSVVHPNRHRTSSNTKSNKKESSSKYIIKQKVSDKQSSNLEKKVEKLMKVCANSDSESL